MKNIFCLLLAAFAVTVAGNELATGSNDMGKLAASCLKKGDVKPFRDGDREIALIRAHNGFTRMTLRMPEGSLGKCYLLTVTAKANTSDAQIMLTEGFLWGSSQKVKRFIRKVIAGDNEYAEYEIPFQVEALPFYVNFGILYDEKGEMRVAGLNLAEISVQKFNELARGNSEYPRDRSRIELLAAAKERLLKSTAAIAGNSKLAPALREYAKNLHRRVGALRMGKDEKLLNEADRVIGDAEKIVIVAGKINPEKVMARNGTVRLRLFNFHAEHSVWARLAADDPGGEYRMVAPDGGKYLLNNADLVNLPAGEGVEVEISELGKSAELTVYPLDHFGSDVWRRVKIENQ